MSTHAARAHGPAALGGSVRRFTELTLTLARTDFKLRYFGSALGYLWSLMRPLLFFGVIYVFFTQIVNISKGVPHYGVYLLTGIVLWNYFAESTMGCVTCLAAREPMLRKVRFPRMVIPLAVSLTAVFNLGMNFIAVIVFALANGIQPALSWLWMFPIVLGFVILATGIGMLLAALYVRYRDIAPIWEVVAQILFYSTPIMYLASSYKSFEHIAMMNPTAMLMTQMGHAFIHPAPILTAVATKTGTMLLPQQAMRSAAAAAGGSVRVLIPILLIPAIFSLGWWYFTREAPRVAENL